MDDIIVEPVGGADKNPAAAADAFKEYLHSYDTLKEIYRNDIVRQRLMEFSIIMILNQEFNGEIT